MGRSTRSKFDEEGEDDMDVEQPLVEEPETPVEEEKDEEEEADEEVFDEKAQQAAIDAERELRTTEEEEEPELEMSMSEPSVDNNYPTDIRGKLFALSSLDVFTRDKKTLTKLIEANGGKVTSKLTSKVDVLIAAKDSKAWKIASNSKKPIFCAGEEYFTNFF